MRDMTKKEAPTNFKIRKQEFSCNYEGCDRVFTRNFRLSLHINSFHNGNKKYHECEHPNCIKRFEEKGNLIVH